MTFPEPNFNITSTKISPYSCIDRTAQHAPLCVCLLSLLVHVVKPLPRSLALALHKQLHTTRNHSANQPMLFLQRQNA